MKKQTLSGGCRGGGKFSLLVKDFYLVIDVAIELDQYNDIISVINKYKKKFPDNNVKVNITTYINSSGKWFYRVLSDSEHFKKYFLKKF